jgi:hypothetical protein
MVMRTAAIAVALGGCSYITDGFTTNDFSGDPFPFGVETTSGAIVIGMQPVGDTLRAAVLDVMSPVTVIDHGTDALQTIQYPDIVLDGTRFPGGPLDLPRARLAGHQLLTLHPCSEPGCNVGPFGAPRPIDGIVGMDSFSSDALRLDLASDQIFVLPDIAGSDTDRSYACDAVLPIAFRGGGTLLVGGTEVGFSNWRIVMPACGAFDPDPNVYESGRGADLLFVASTGVGTSILSASGYERYRVTDPSAPVYDPTILTTVYLPSGPVSGFATTLASLALVGNSSSTPRSPCHQVYANTLLAAQDCTNPNDPDTCPCSEGQTYCPAPAIVELTPPAKVPVLVVDDADATLQALRAELRPNQPEIDGILGTSVLGGVELDLDYPHQRLLARCTDDTQCAIRPELFGDIAERIQVQGCLGITP